MFYREIEYNVNSSGLGTNKSVKQLNGNAWPILFCAYCSRIGLILGQCKNYYLSSVEGISSKMAFIRFMSNLVRRS